MIEMYLFPIGISPHLKAFEDSLEDERRHFVGARHIATLGRAAGVRTDARPAGPHARGWLRSTEPPRIVSGYTNFLLLRARARMGTAQTLRTLPITSFIDPRRSAKCCGGRQGDLARRSGHRVGHRVERWAPRTAGCCPTTFVHPAVMTLLHARAGRTLPPPPPASPA